MVRVSVVRGRAQRADCERHDARPGRPLQDRAEGDGGQTVDGEGG